MPTLTDSCEEKDKEDPKKSSEKSEMKTKTDTFKLMSRGKGDLKTVYRPQKFEELAPTCSIEQLRSFVDNPDSSRIFLFEGGTGTGKTTCARIVAKANVCLAEKTQDKPCLDCKNCKNFDSSMDVLEINIADKRKIEDARQLVAEMSYRPQFLGKKIYILDEVQQLTDEAQQVLLKHLEEPKDYIWIFLCTTDKQGLRKTLIDRANTVTFHNIASKDANDIINQVLDRASKTASPEMKSSFLTNSQGSVRALLNNLQSYIEGGYDPNKSLDDEETASVKELCTAILSKRIENLAVSLKKNEFRNNAEKTRIGVESYFRGCLLNNSGNVKFLPLLEIMVGPLQGPMYYNDLVCRCFKAFEIDKSKSSA